ncbi:MAG TPA: hypothetical protein VFJ90_01310 [Candidatus Didemnitutus sp.]|nr:hypothetical protein [Candidatus Didemnitutus sp.]
MNFRFQAVLVTLLLSAAVPRCLLAQTSAADAAWDQLSSKKGSGKSAAGAPAPDWAAVARDADDFSRNFPSDERAKGAKRIGLSAQIRMQDGSKNLSPEVIDAAENYIKDSGNNVRDRVDLRIDLDQSKIRHQAGLTDDQLRAAKTAHAHSLIREFPDQSEGYGLLLAIAKTEEAPGARSLATELLKSSAPEKYKAGAQRVLDRLDLINARLTVMGADPTFPSAKGKSVVIYSWRVADEGFLQIIRRHAKDDLVFIGVNVDTDIGAAKAVAGSLPGTHYFEGGTDGPLSRQLCFLYAPSLYLVDDHGVLREVNGTKNPEALFASAAGKGGAK